ncbi:ArgK/MeaB family GTPase [Nocardia sp. NPDC059239]|uniref:ArgK/MeaB family GTPase n=1 Tax=Nocardia sp. NPDC059239 TaxID=3346785 RepID=UPI0036955A99
MDTLLTDVREGSRRAVSRALSRLENGDAELTAAALRLSRSSAWVLGITGAPGVGKSSTIRRLIELGRRAQRRIAILAFDPTSINSGGALLGDRLRMAEVLDAEASVYMRSMATRLHLGGLSRSCPAAVNILASAGFDMIIVETVGVGQSEVDVMRLADTVLVIVGPNSGDWVQAAKGGVMEIGDVVGISKSDLDGAADTFRDVRAIIGHRPGSEAIIPVVPFSAHQKNGLDQLWQELLACAKAGSQVTDGSAMRTLVHSTIDAVLDGLTDSAMTELMASTSSSELLWHLADLVTAERPPLDERNEGA